LIDAARRRKVHSVTFWGRREGADGGDMPHYLVGLGLITFTACVVLFADYLLKLASDRGLGAFSVAVAIGVVLYAVSALLWFAAMRHVTLGQAGVAYSMLTLVALAIIGALFFGERLGFREVAGIGCALTAMVLMIRVG
jgi:drug/metabolite transporter (DMT)-like permease